MNRESLIRIIENIKSNGWEEYSAFFNNDLSLFLNIVKRNDLLDLIDPMDTNFEDYENEILWAKLEDNPKETCRYIASEVINNDIEIVDGKYFLVISSVTDLANLFKSGSRHNLSSYDVANIILGGDDWEHYSDTVYDLYDNVISELNSNNLYKLKETVSKEILGQRIEVATRLLKNFCEDSESCDDDTIEVTAEMIDDMLDDGKTVNFIFNEYLKELKWELYNLHDNAYNSAYHSEMYDSVWNELSTYFVGQEINKSRPNRYDETKQTRYQIIEIRDLDRDISHFLSENKTSKYNEDKLSYLGGYLEMLKSGQHYGIFEDLDFRIPDYPNHRLVRQNINEYFDNYLL